MARDALAALEYAVMMEVVMNRTGGSIVLRASAGARAFNIFAERSRVCNVVRLS
jgi:hypothetical protein